MLLLVIAMTNTTKHHTETRENEKKAIQKINFHHDELAKALDSLKDESYTVSLQDMRDSLRDFYRSYLMWKNTERWMLDKDGNEF